MGHLVSNGTWHSIHTAHVSTTHNQTTQENTQKGMSAASTHKRSPRYQKKDLCWCSRPHDVFIPLTFLVSSIITAFRIALIHTPFPRLLRHRTTLFRLYAPKHSLRASEQLLFSKLVTFLFSKHRPRCPRGQRGGCPPASSGG